MPRDARQLRVEVEKQIIDLDALRLCATRAVVVAEARGEARAEVVDVTRLVALEVARTVARAAYELSLVLRWRDEAGGQASMRRPVPQLHV